MKEKSFLKKVGAVALVGSLAAFATINIYDTNQYGNKH